MNKEQLIEQLENLKKYIPEDVSKASHDRVLAEAIEKRNMLVAEISELEAKLENANNYAIVNKAYDAGFLAAKGLEKLADLSDEEFEKYEQELASYIDLSKPLVERLSTEYDELEQRISENEQRLVTWQEELENIKARFVLEPENQELALEVSQKESEVRGAELNLESFRRDLPRRKARYDHEKAVLDQRLAEQKGIEEFKNRPREIDNELKSIDEQTLSTLRQSLAVLNENVKNLEGNTVTEIDELIELVRNDEIDNNEVSVRLVEFKDQVPAVELSEDLTALNDELEDVRFSQKIYTEELAEAKKNKTKDRVRAFQTAIRLSASREREIKHAINEKGSLGSEIDDLVEEINKNTKKSTKVKKGGKKNTKTVNARVKSSPKKESVVATNDEVVESVIALPPIEDLTGPTNNVSDEVSVDEENDRFGFGFIFPPDLEKEELETDNAVDLVENPEDSMAAMIDDQQIELGEDIVEVDDYEDNTDISDKEINKANKKVNKWIKGIVASVGAVVLLIALLVSCGKSKDEAEKIATELSNDEVVNYVENPDYLNNLNEEKPKTEEEIEIPTFVNPVQPPVEDMTDDNKAPEIVDMTTEEQPNYEQESNPGHGSGEQPDDEKDPNPGNGSGEQPDDEKDPNPGHGSGEQPDDEKDPDLEPDEEVTITVNPGDAFFYEGQNEEQVKIDLGSNTESATGITGSKDFTEVEDNGITDMDVNEQGGLEVTFGPGIERTEEEQANYEQDLNKEREESGFDQEEYNQILKEWASLYGDSTVNGDSSVTYTDGIEEGKTR